MASTKRGRRLAFALVAAWLWGCLGARRRADGLGPSG